MLLAGNTPSLLECPASLKDPEQPVRSEVHRLGEGDSRAEEEKQEMEPEGKQEM